MTRWMGPRPSTPDSLPFIGPAPRHRSIYFAFGHSHMGLAWAAVTGKLIAEMVAGQSPSLDCGPYRPDRF
jgi:D-amino-acid dehydrogenase